jgi:hypothetical protein
VPVYERVFGQNGQLLFQLPFDPAHCHYQYDGVRYVREEFFEKQFKVDDQLTFDRVTIGEPVDLQGKVAKYYH